MKVRQKPWRKGIGEGLVGLGALAGLGALSPWVILILLIIIAVVGIIGWAFLHIYGLVTAFVGFIAGLVIVWLGLHLIPERDRGESAFKLMLIPITLGVLGYLAEKFNIWTAPLNYRFSLQAFVVNFDTTVSLNTLLLVVIAVCVVAELAFKLVKK